MTEQKPGWTMIGRDKWERDGDVIQRKRGTGGFYRWKVTFANGWHYTGDSVDEVMAYADTRNGRPLAEKPARPYGEVMDEIDHDAKLAQEAGPTHQIAYVTVPRSTLQTAVLALRSYEHGNAAPALAKEVADLIEGMIGYAPAAVRS